MSGSQQPSAQDIIGLSDSDMIIGWIRAEIEVVRLRSPEQEIAALRAVDQCLDKVDALISSYRAQIRGQKILLCLHVESKAQMELEVVRLRASLDFERRGKPLLIKIISHLFSPRVRSK